MPWPRRQRQQYLQARRWTGPFRRVPESSGARWEQEEDQIPDRATRYALGGCVFRTRSLAVGVLIIRVRFVARSQHRSDVDRGQVTAAQSVPHLAVASD